MCLKTVTKKRKANDLVKVGYKVFYKKSHVSVEYKSLCYDSYMLRKMGGKYDAASKEKRTVRNDAITSTDHQRYDRGFHIWSEIADARDDCMLHNNVIVEVIAWDIRAYGKNDIGGKRQDLPGKCFVARHIRLMKEV